MEVGGLEDKAGIWRRLEAGEKGEGEKHLGKMVDLEVGVCVQGIRVEYVAMSLSCQDSTVEGSFVTYLCHHL